MNHHEIRRRYSRRIDRSRRNELSPLIYSYPTEMVVAILNMELRGRTRLEGVHGGFCTLVWTRATARFPIHGTCLHRINVRHNTPPMTTNARHLLTIMKFVPREEILELCRGGASE